MKAHWRIGGILFPGIDQADLTGPFEVLSRLPGADFRIIGANREPVRDVQGLILTPDTEFADAPALDVLVVPGGTGVSTAMQAAETLAFIRRQAAGAARVLSVCTGALLLGAAGLLKGRRATTHWASHHLLAEWGAIPCPERVVEDGKFIFCSGVTAGLDGALLAAARLAGDEIAQGIQLYLEYDPQPPFPSGTPATASPAVLAAVRSSLVGVIEERERIVRRLSLSAAANPPLPIVPPRANSEE